ncbi:hypothetical protein CAPTEDRAFT_121491, partial [Capitella teleta]
HDSHQVLLLMTENIDVNFCSPNGLTLLHKCCIGDNLRAAETLLANGADINAQDSDGWTPLHFSCQLDRVDIVQLLLSNGADCCILDVDGNFAVDHAPQGSFSLYYIQKHLQDLGIDQDQLQYFRLEAPRKMLTDVQEMIEMGEDLNRPGENGVTMVMHHRWLLR